MKTNITLLFFGLFSLPTFSQLNMTLRGQVEFNQRTTDVWGWADGNGNEYAIIGAYNGVAIVDVTDPDNPEKVAFLEGIPSDWRDIKTWRTNAYVTNESGSGVMVIDLSQLPDSASSYNWEPQLGDLGWLRRCHNIFIDEFGVAYLAGCNLNAGGMIYLDVNTLDGTPEYINHGPNTYSHDVYVRDNKAYASEINLGQFAIYDVSDKANTVELGSQFTPLFFTHNAWLSDDGQSLFTTDERASAPVSSYDVSDPENIIELDQFRPYASYGTDVIPHNVHVWQDWIIVSYYTDGCIVIDASEPDNLIEVGNFDTWISAQTGFSGAWGAYPFLPSQTILVSDRFNGLYVLTPNYVRAARIQGRIFDTSNNEDLGDVEINSNAEILEELSAFDGKYKTGFHSGGTYNFTFSKIGYYSKIIEVELISDEIITLNVGLDPIPQFNVAANVLDAESGVQVSTAKIRIWNADFEYKAYSDAAGNFNLESVYEGIYDVAVGKWGYKTIVLTDQDFSGNNKNFQFEISKGYEDNFELDLDWILSNFADSGDWELANPLGVRELPDGIYVSPFKDDSNDLGKRAFVTDNGPDIEANSVKNGNNSIKSQKFDMSQAIEPKISFSSWFFSGFPTIGLAGKDVLEFRLFNGDTIVLIEQIKMAEKVQPTWEEHEYNIKDFITPTADMQFEVQIMASNDFYITEGGIDNFKAWDAMASSLIENSASQLHFIALPNPTSDHFTLEIETNDSSHQRLTIYSILGQPIESIALVGDTQRIQIGADYPKGVYLAQLEINGTITKTLKLIKH